MNKINFNLNDEIIVITGATASGKTSAAIEFAKKNDAEIICADSRTVFCGLDVVSAKVKEEEKCGIAHHLLDVVELNSEFSAQDFSSLAIEAICDIKNRGKRVVVCGGTWFYIKALLEESSMPEVPPNKILREDLMTKNADEIWSILYKLDKDRANSVHKNNVDKVIRSIELCIGLEMPVSKYVRPLKKQIYPSRWFLCDLKREELYSRIDTRVDKMLEDGLYEEFLANREKYPNSLILRNTIGYKEFFELEEGLYATKEEAVSKIKQRTRNFAKRQLTYFRSNKELLPIAALDAHQLD